MAVHIVLINMKSLRIFFSSLAFRQCWLDREISSTSSEATAVRTQVRSHQCLPRVWSQQHRLAVIALHQIAFRIFNTSFPQNIKHIITAAYESVRASHSSHLFHRDNLSKSLGKCHRERAEAGFALESAAPTACKQHQEWHGGLSGVDKGALHHWAQTRGDSFVLNLLPFCSEL